MTEYDVFISYASEDREEIAIPLANELKRHKLRVWIDKSVLQVGDSLSRSIDEGLNRSSYAVVILSPHYRKKSWTIYELRGLLAKEARGRKVVLPVWHNLSRLEVEEFSLPLADKLALVSGEIDIKEMALRIRDVVTPKTARRGATSIGNSGRQKQISQTKTKKPRPVKAASHPSKDGEQPGAVASDWITPTDSSRTLSVGEFKTRNSLSVDEAKQLARSSAKILRFHGELELSPAAARELAQWPGEELEILGFWDFSTEIAQELACWNGRTLELHLSELEPGDALALAQWPGETLKMKSLSHISLAAAQHLAAWPGRVLELGYLHVLNPETAQALARWAGEKLVLEQLSELPVEAARFLAEWRGASLDLSGVKKLPLRSVEHLSHWPGKTLCLRYLRKLTPRMAACLAKWPGKELNLEGIKAVSTRAARNLYSWRGKTLWLDSSSRIGGAAQSYFRQWSGQGNEEKFDSELYRAANIPDRPQDFGVVPTLIRIWRGQHSLGTDGEDEVDLQPWPVSPISRGDLRRRREAWTSMRHLIAGSVLLAALLAALVIWLAKSQTATTLIGYLRITEGAGSGPLDNVLAVPKFLGRLILALLPPTLIAGIFMLAIALFDVVDDSLDRKENMAIERLLTALLIVSAISMLAITFRVIFPEFVSTERFRHTFFLTSDLAGFCDGLWQGFFNVPRTFLFGFPPHATNNTGWLFYLPGYFLGLLASPLAFAWGTRLVFFALVGFNGRRLDEVDSNSHFEETTVAFSLLYLGWCILVAAWAVFR